MLVDWLLAKDLYIVLDEMSGYLTEVYNVHSVPSTVCVCK